MNRMRNKKIALIILTVTLSGLLMSGLNNCKKQSQQKSGKEKKSVKDTPEDKPLPKIVVKEGTKRNLGKLREGIKTTVSFTLINKGKADASKISVHDLSKGGCTAVSQVSELARGDSAKLKFIFETLGYGGNEETREIKVRYDNSRHSPITLSVTAEVLPVKEHQVPIGELYYNFFVLLDVRGEQDFRKGHIAGAIHVPEDELLPWVSRLPKDFMIYLCSETGKKSDKLAKQLRKKGFSETLSIVGGIEEWKRRYGERVIIQGGK